MRANPAGMKKQVFLFLVTLCAAIAASESKTDDLSILFVGNSLTSQNSLPVFVERLLEKQDGVEVRVEAITRPGATMWDHARDGEALAAISSNSFDFAFLQERGGTLLCLRSESSRDSDECRKSINAHRQLAEGVKERGGQALILGTYNNPDVAVALGKAEADLARRIGADHVQTADAWLRASGDESLGDWFAEDGVHPGRTMTALMGVLLHAKIAGECPDASRIEWPSDGGSENLLGITDREMRVLTETCRQL